MYFRLQDTDAVSAVFDVDAEDDDEGKNGRIKYSIDSVRGIFNMSTSLTIAVQVVPASGSDTFYIFVSSGEIYLNKMLDYEDTTEYTLTIVAAVRYYYHVLM